MPRPLPPEVQRTLIVGALMWIVVAWIETCLSGSYFHWPFVFLGIYVLLRAARLHR